MPISAVIVDLSLPELKAGLASGGMVVLDVREAHEYAAGHIPGAINRPLSTFDPADLPDTGKRLVVACAAGVRSLKAIAIAHEDGVTLTDHFPGGFKEWAGAGEKVDR